MESTALRVLLVEDQADIAEMYRLRLDLDGFTVQIAPTGDQALGLVAAGWPDLVLLDLCVPDMDGFAVMNRLRSQKRTAPLSVIILTNEDDPELVTRAFELGALDFLHMSRVTPDAVSMRIKIWAEKRHKIGVA